MLQNVCQIALTVKCSYYTQKAACNTFIKLIELYKDYDIELAEMAEKFIKTLYTYEIKGENTGFDSNYRM